MNVQTIRVVMPARAFIDSDRGAGGECAGLYGWSKCPRGHLLILMALKNSHGIEYRDRLNAREGIY